MNRLLPDHKPDPYAVAGLNLRLGERSLKYLFEKHVARMRTSPMWFVEYHRFRGKMATSCGFELVLNGEAIRVADELPQTTLLDYVRSRGLTGAKEGCAEGECGACAVLLVSSGPSGARYEAVNSCLVALPSVANREVYTVEALARDGALAPAQQAMANAGGSQCGYCTPGFVVSMFAQHYCGDRDVHSLGGNLCRCTGYRPIRDALHSLGSAPPGFFLDRLSRPVPTLLPLDYQTSKGRFSRPGNLQECLDLAVADSSARFLAGNTDLGVLTNLRDRRFAHLISLEGVAELREFHEDETSIEIGAGLTLTEIGERWHSAPQAFREWLKLFASPLIRNRATLGGNLATASPIGDAAPLLLALDAELRLVSTQGERIVPLSSFFHAFRETELKRGELIRSICIPKPLPAHLRFYKLAKRGLDDISTVAAGISVRSDGAVRIGLGGVAAVPLRALEAEQMLDFENPGSIERAKDVLRRTLRPISDHRGSAKYRLAMAQTLLDKFWFEEFRGD
jgi:xanthine dehydrogenase small subunit